MSKLPLTADVGDAQVDLDRPAAAAFPEVVFAEGKTVAAMEKIFQALLSHGADVLATRMSAEQAAELVAQFPAGRYNAVGRTFRIARSSARNAKDAARDESGRVVDYYGRHERPARGRRGPRNGPLDRGGSELDPGRGRGRATSPDGQPARCWARPTRWWSWPAWKGRCPAWWAATSPVR